MKNQGSSLIHRYTKIFLVVSAYWFISISIIFINKTLFSSDIFNLKAPLFVTWTQCLTSVGICLGWKQLAQWFPSLFSFPKSKPFCRRTLKVVIPVSLLFILTISFGNLSLSFVEVSFYFISRSLTTVFNVCFTYLILHQVTSFKALFCCFIIIFGFFFGVDQENDLGSFSLQGTLFGVLSSISLSLYSISTKKVLPEVDNEVILLTYYNNLYSSVLFIPLIILTKEHEKLKVIHFYDPSFWILTFIGGAFGFLIGFVSALQIKVTSPLTHNISGTAKACAQTVIATYWYQEVKPWAWWFSNFIVLFGSAAYARVKQLEMTVKC